MESRRMALLLQAPMVCAAITEAAGQKLPQRML